MLLPILGAVAGLLVLGAIYEQVARRQERSYPLPGRLVEVGGSRLHLIERGEGGPTVVLIHGAGDSSYSWLAVQREVAAFTQVVSYDRPGLGSSDSGPAPDAVNTLTELEAILHQSGLAGPYVLVGHSLGGLLARRYAIHHPEKVAGLVLVDSTHEFLRDDRKFQQGFAAIGFMLRVMKALSVVGLPRFLGEVLKVMPMYPERAAYAKQLSREAYRLWAASVYRNVRTDGGVKEFAGVAGLLQASWALRKPDAEQPQFGDLPMVVLTNPGFGENWVDMHRELAGRSRNSSHQISDRHGHNLQMLRPDLVLTAIRHVVDEARRRAAAQAR